MNKDTIQAPKDARWEKARLGLIRRWQEIVRAIGRHDEGDVLMKATVMDEFCDQAGRDRDGAYQSGGALPDSGRARPTAGTPITRCIFCKGFVESGGCQGMLTGLFRLVFAGDWEKASRVANEYLNRLCSMSVTNYPRRADPEGLRPPLATRSGAGDRH